MATQFPIHVVCAWLDHDALIAKKHYLQVTETDFERAPLATMCELVLACAMYSTIPDRSRTCNLRLRRPTLYPVELRARKAIDDCKA